MPEGREVDVKLVIQAQMKGAQRIIQDAQRIKTALGGDVLAKSMDAFEKSLDKVREHLSAGAKDAKAFDQSLRAFSRSTQGLRVMVQLMRQLKQETQQTQQAASRGPFAQGFIQGAGITQFVGRGPGMGQQVAGIAAGRVARGGAQFAGGIASATFSGAAGISQALQGIPLIGGLAAGQFQQGQMAAQQAFQFEQQATRFLGLSGLRPIGQAVAGVGQLDEGAVQLAGAQRGLAASNLMRQRLVNEKAAAMSRTERRRLESGALTPNQRRQLLGQPSIREEATGVVERESGLLIAGAGESARRNFIEDQQRAHRERQTTARNMGRRNAMQQAIMGIRETGEAVGFGLPEALRIAEGVARVGGGDPLADRNQQAQRFGLTAQRAFGIGPQTTGQFLFGQRRGALTGGLSAEGAFNEGIRDAMRMGLEGSELNQHMAEMARDIGEFRRTGMPLSIKAVGAIGLVIGTGLGLGAVRGGAIQGQFRRAGQRLAMRGPRRMDDIQFLRFFGGLSQEEFENLGPSALLRAQQNLETGETIAPNIGRFMVHMMQQAGIRDPARASQEDISRGVLFGQQRLAGFGITISPTEAEISFRRAANLKVSPRLLGIQRARREGILGGLEETGEARAARFETEGGVTGRAIALTSSRLRREAELMNKMIDAGGPLIGIFQDLTAAQRISLESLAEFSGGIRVLTKAIVDASGKIKAAAKELANSQRKPR